MTKTPPEDADPEEDNDDDEDDTMVTPGHVLQSNGEVAMPAETFLNFLRFARQQSSENDVASSVLSRDAAHHRTHNPSLANHHYNDGGDSDCGCDDSDEYSDGDFDDEDSEVEMILEEIRRISEALLGTTVSELIDAERRVSLKDFDELAARDESLLEEWDYDDSEICEHDDDCQGVVERIQLYMRSHPAQLSENIRRELTEMRNTNCRPSRPAENRRVPTNPGGTSNIYVVYFEPRKLGMLPKFGAKDESKSTPKLKRTVSLKKAAQRVRFDKDSVRRWSEDDEKEEITRLLQVVRGLPGPVSRMVVPRLPVVPWAGMQISLQGLESTPAPPVPHQPPLPALPPPSPTYAEGTLMYPELPREPFAVTLPVGSAAPTEVHVVLFANRVLAAEVVQHVPLSAAVAPTPLSAGVSEDSDERGDTSRLEAGAAAYAAAGRLACESVLVRRWLVPSGVDLDTLRCYLGDGLLLVAAYPLPEGFVWPFAVPPAVLGPPLHVAWACDYVP